MSRAELINKLETVWSGSLNGRYPQNSQNGPACQPWCTRGFDNSSNADVRLTLVIGMATRVELVAYGGACQVRG